MYLLLLLSIVVPIIVAEYGLPPECNIDTSSNKRFVRKLPCNCNGFNFPSNYSSFLQNNNLEEINLSGCNFTGSILDLDRLDSNKLNSIDLSGNQFTGQLTSSFISKYNDKLVLLDLSNNKFNGDLPGSISFPRIKKFNLANNGFTGSIFDLLKALPYGITYFSVANNSFSGDLPDNKPSFINNNGLNSDNSYQLKCVVYYPGFLKYAPIALPNWCRSMGNNCYCPGQCGNGILEADEECLSTGLFAGECCENCKFKKSDRECGTGQLCSIYYCTGDNAYCPYNPSLRPPSHICRNSEGLCDKPEYCTGSLDQCPEDSFYNSSQVCRFSNGDCDIEETCIYGNATCPEDRLKDSSTECRKSEGDCDLAEYCLGNSSNCPTDTFMNKTVVCRPVSDICDTAENCTGNNATCPQDKFLGKDKTCRPMVGLCDIGENCPGNNATCPEDLFLGTNTICRPIVGLCDIAENCTGISPNCTKDIYKQKNTICRPSEGLCDIAESCSGMSPNCTQDMFKGKDIECKISAGPCDIGENCTGTDAKCPIDLFQPSNITCREINGDCDLAEFCSGNSSACPNDTFINKTVLCRPVSDICDIAEYCTGNNATCPQDLFLGKDEICRISAGPCDIAENCTGISPNCTQDIFKDKDKECRTSAGPCDIGENCTGTDAECPLDLFQLSNITCRGVNGDCDTAEYCTGNNESCPEDQFLDKDDICRISAGPCDIGEYCTGDNASCPKDIFKDTKEECRPSSGECDIGENCTNEDAACPEDLFQLSNIICREVNGVCDKKEYCTGINSTCPEDLVLNESIICRPSIGICDADDFCDGRNSSCPDDKYKNEINVCQFAHGCLASSSCTGTSVECPQAPLLTCSEGECNRTTSKCTGFCGDGICDDTRFEDCANCLSDCPAPCGKCGDLLCEDSIGENCTTCKVDCLSSCDIPCKYACIHGTCNKGICECVGNAFGPDCGNETIKIDSSEIGGGSVLVKLNSTSFSLSFVGIAEEDVNKRTLAFVNVSSLDFSQSHYNTSQFEVYTFTSELSFSSSKKRISNAAKLEVRVFFFIVTTNFTFASNNITMAPNTFKVEVSIYDWPFQSTRSTLRIIFESTMTDKMDDCNYEYHVDSTDNLRWIMLTSGGVSFYSQMLEYALVDGNEHIIHYSLEGQQLISAQVPFFWHNMTLDPNIGFLVAGDHNNEKRECNYNKNDKKWTDRWEIFLSIPLGVLVLVLFVALLYNGTRLRNWIKERRKPRCSVEIDMADEL